MSDAFFRTLFSEVSVDTVVKCFTHMLCQTPTIIAAKTLNSLVPIHQALYSLIYPFTYPISNPCIHNNETEEDDENELSNVITLCPIFNGILEEDKLLAEKIIRDNQLNTPPLMIDLTLPDDMEKEKYRLVANSNQVKINNPQQQSINREMKKIHTGLP